MLTFLSQSSWDLRYASSIFNSFECSKNSLANVRNRQISSTYPKRNTPVIKRSFLKWGLVPSRISSAIKKNMLPLSSKRYLCIHIARARKNLIRSLDGQSWWDAIEKRSGECPDCAHDQLAWIAHNQVRQSANQSWDRQQRDRPHLQERTRLPQRTGS